MNKNLSWEKIGEEESIKVGWRKIVRKKFHLLNGNTADYDIKDEGRTVAILAMDKQNNVMLVEIFRPGPEKVLIEMPGGQIESEENPLEAAKRELREELGFEGELELAGEVVDDAYSNCIRYVVIAKNCQKVGDPIWEEDEESRLVTMTLDQFRKHLRSGQMTDVELGYLGLDYLGLL